MGAQASKALELMSLIRTFRFVMRPTADQRRTFDEWRILCCGLYNAALEQRRDAWRMRKQSVSYVYQCRDLTELRNADESGGYDGVPVEVARSALRRLDRAFQAFFRRVKSGDTPGFPRFRSRDRFDSFGLGNVSIRPGDGDSGYVRVPKLGWVRFKLHRELHGVVKNVEVRRDARGRWFVCIACDVGDAPAKRVVRSATGIDLGLKEFAVLSDGEAVHNPRHFRRGQVALRRAQRVLARKTRGSNSRRRAREAVARQHERTRNQRVDFHRKLAADLCSRFDLIAHEDLNIKGLARGMLAKSVSDVAWGSFLQRLACKAESAGVHLVAVDPRNTTQACSQCGTLVPKGLGDRIHACECGCVLDRDHNAALNVLARGLRASPGFVPAEVSSGSVQF